MNWNIQKIPANLAVTEKETIEAVLQAVSVAEEKITTKGKEIDIPKLIQENGLQLAYSAPYQGGMKYILSVCPFDNSHTDKSAYIIQFASGAVAVGCHHDSCKGKDWQMLKKLLNISAEKPKVVDGEKQADVIITLAKDALFFKDGLENTYAAVAVNGHTETMAINSAKFKSYLTKLYYEHTNSAPSSDTMSQALKVLEMKALFSEHEQKLEKRMTYHEGSYYYDLCNKDWSVIRYDDNSIELLKENSPLFTRSRNMKEQQLPDLTAKPEILLDIIKKHFRFKKETDILLFTVYLVTNFIPNIAHVVLVLFGEKGAAKSTTMRMIKRVVDPAIQELLSMPSSLQDLALTLFNNYMPCFDNIDSLSAEKSDMLCMAATGGAITKRTLYTDAEETILEIKRPIGINGINIVATRADLLDRAILLELERIPKTERKTEKDIWTAYDKDIPLILGAIFNTIKEAIVMYNEVELVEVGRMADFTYWGYAIAEVLGISGQVFLSAYLSNQDTANEEALASHPVAAAVTALLRDCSSWEGSVSALLGQLEKVAENEHINTRVRTWPKDANILSKRLKEVKSNLEEVGIYYEIRHGGNYKNISLYKKAESLTPVAQKRRKRNESYISEECSESGLFSDETEE